MFKDENIASSKKIFSSPFNLAVDNVQEEIKMELIKMKNNTELKNAFSQCPLKFFINLMLTPNFRF